MMDPYEYEVGAEALPGGSGTTSPSASGPGVQSGENAAQADKGYGCIASFPLSGGFWQRPPKRGEA